MESMKWVIFNLIQTYTEIRITMFYMHLQEICVTKLEAETLEESFTLEILFAACLGIIGVVINRVGKFPILGT